MNEDEELFNRCMLFCMDLFHLMNKKNELSNTYYPYEEKENILDFEKERVKYSFTKLCELVDEIRGVKK